MSYGVNKIMSMYRGISKKNYFIFKKKITIKFIFLMTSQDVFLIGKYNKHFVNVITAFLH